jgi:hypothetical protein
MKVVSVAELLGEIIRAAKQVHRGGRAIEQLIHAREQHAVGIDEVHLVLRDELLERLHRRVMAAGLIAHRDGHAGQIFRAFDLRVRLHENSRRRHRIDLACHAAVTLGGRDIHRPVAGAGDIGLAPRLERLHGADLVALVVLLAVGRADEFAKFVVEAFVGEIAFVVRDPFLKAEMRLDDELRHGRLPEIVLTLRLGR